MFVRIRPEQMKVFDDLARAKLDRWLVAHVERRWPERVLRVGSTKALDRILEDAVAAALRYGCKGSEEVVAYVDLVMLLGPGFASDRRLPGVGALLARADLDGEQKIRVVQGIVSAMALHAVGPEWGFE